MSSVAFRGWMRSVQGGGVERARGDRNLVRRDLKLDAHLAAIRAKFNADEQSVLDRAVERLRHGSLETEVGLATRCAFARIAALSVDDAVDELRLEMRSSPMIHRDGDPA